MNDFFDYGLDDIDFKTNLPTPIVKEHEGIQVVRDDLIDGGTIYINRDGDDKDDNKSPRLASSLTLMEVSA